MIRLNRSENPFGADDQQETKIGHWPMSRILRDCTPSIQLRLDEETVRAAWRHAEAGRNVQPTMLRTLADLARVSIPSETR